MAGNNSIQILRGNNISGRSEELLPGQPVYDMATGYLRIGSGGSISNTTPIKASYANTAGTLSSTLSISSGGTGATNASQALKNLMMNSSRYSNPGDSEYLVFATSSTTRRYNYGYIKNDITNVRQIYESGGTLYITTD